MNTNPERPQELNVSTKSNPLKPLTIQPKKILIKGKARKEKVKYLFDSLDIPLPKKDNQKDTSTDKVN